MSQALQKMTLPMLNRQIVACDRCSRLRVYCRQIAVEKRRAFSDWDYWGKPVPGFGDPAARIWIIGLAPAAHGANRTGRVFTGDRSGDFLFAALHRLGLANQPTSISRDDGLQLRDVYISATARCAPPANKPLPGEIANCAEYLDHEWRLLNRKRVLLALGKIGWDACCRAAARHGADGDSKIEFAHGAMRRVAESLTLIGSYHVSQQNTFTGKLTAEMFDAVLAKCLRASGI